METRKGLAKDNFESLFKFGSALETYVALKAYDMALKELEHLQLARNKFLENENDVRKVFSGCFVPHLYIKCSGLLLGPRI